MKASKSRTSNLQALVLSPTLMNANSPAATNLRNSHGDRDKYLAACLVRSRRCGSASAGELGLFLIYLRFTEHSHGFPECVVIGFLELLPEKSGHSPRCIRRRMTVSPMPRHSPQRFPR